MSDFNPFAALIEDKTEQPCSTSLSINSILQIVFGFTLDESQSSRYIYLDEVAKSFHRKDLDVPVLQHALFDRLFLCTDENSILTDSRRHYDFHYKEPKVVTYLYSCYQSLRDRTDLTDDEKVKLTAMIMQNSVTAFVQSDIYYGQDLDAQLVDILKGGQAYYDEFFKGFCKAMLESEDGGVEYLKDTLSQILLSVTSEIIKSNIVNFDYQIFDVLNLFSKDEYLAGVFLDVKPARFDFGGHYAGTPLGALFNISILPKIPDGKYEHFLDPTDQAGISNTEGILWSNVNNFAQHIYTLVWNLLKCSTPIKNKTLEWLGQCLKMNADRRKLWNSHMPANALNPASHRLVTDGFMVNFTNVMLRLSEPFCDFNDKKILKVDPTYCGVPNDQLSDKGIHLADMSTETCLISKDDDEQLAVADKYNFITDCFFLTSRAVDLGYQVAVDKMVRLNYEVGRMERAYVDAVSQRGGNSDVVNMLKNSMTKMLTTYLCLRAQLSDPVLLKYLFNFVSASSYWLCQIAIDRNQPKANAFAPLEEIPINFPLPDQIPNTLKYIPEFLIENCVSYLVFLRRFSPKIFEERGFAQMSPILDFILIFMGSPERVRNPHVRARLAEALEALLPHHKDEPANLNVFGGFQREKLFTEHKHRNEIVANLLQVFVGIEMTGQSVEFEQKFNYRRPMYAIMDYLWTKTEYRACFKRLAEYAEKNMEAVVPPLFLRFVNLLMNDAVYLLDEALSNMAKLKEMQTARDNGEWDSLPPNERSQNDSHMTHTGMLAKFDNILGRDTIKTLERCTSEITIVFTHSTMVDRVAAMLNYFLLNLVGPNKKNFKVKDQKEFNFDPANTVLNICQIYVNLKASDAFCLAVSQDGRSYSPQLFSLAENVLIRISGGSLIGELKEVAEKVAQKSKEHQANEEAVAEAPEHFLDPIMSTLMTDPVILPSSKQTVDRTTIARHLLSDQTDPFNRAPLSMDQVIPNAELADEIKRWIAERTSK